jgi:AcrR family transcriptional regulator
MPRPLDTVRRTELLEGTIRYAARHGIAELSLRPLAAALGTSSRMLVHYFGTKEELIGQALAAATPDIPALLAQHSAVTHSPETIASRLWKDISAGGEQEPRIRLLLEVMALALTQPQLYGSHATEALRPWIEPLAHGLHAAGHNRREAAARATVLVSGLRGLALDRYLTGDQQRTDDAAALLIAAATASARTGPGPSITHPGRRNAR